MSKITITIEDLAEGVIIVGDPSMSDLIAKAKARHQMTAGESLGLAAWIAIGDRARQIGETQQGETL